MAFAAADMLMEDGLDILIDGADTVRAKKLIKKCMKYLDEVEGDKTLIHSL